MDSVDYQFLEPEKRIGQAPTLKQWTIGFSLLLSLLALVTRLYLQNNIAHYQQLNAHLQKQITQLSRKSAPKISLEIKQQQEKFLNLLQLISQALPAGMLLTQLQIDGDSLFIKGTVTNKEGIKTYVKNLASSFNLDDFSFEPNNEQTLNFSLRFSFL